MSTTYKNNGGAHMTANGTIIPNGGVFQDENPDLCKVFPNKFAVVHTPAPTPAADDPTPAPAAPAQATTPIAAPAKPTGVVVVDVTDEYPAAEDADLTVTKVKGGYDVYDEDKSEPINEKPLAKKKVQLFLDEYLAE